MQIRMRTIPRGGMSIMRNMSWGGPLHSVQGAMGVAPLLVGLSQLWPFGRLLLDLASGEAEVASLGGLIYLLVRIAMMLFLIFMGWHWGKAGWNPGTTLPGWSQEGR